MTMTIDLKKFCGNGGRYSVNEPWVFKGWMYATTGKILVRVRAEGQADTETETTLPPAHEIFESHQGVTFHPWPVAEYITRPKACPECHGSKTDICPHCDREGKCDECRGTGLVDSSQLKIVDRYISREHDELIRALPSPEYSVDTPANRPLPFHFDGGEGLVMPIPNYES